MSQCLFIHHKSHMNWPGIELYTHNSRHPNVQLSICWLLRRDWTLDYESHNLCREEGRSELASQSDSEYHVSQSISICINT
jgi:hypothetical protein